MNPGAFLKFHNAQPLANLSKIPKILSDFVLPRLKKWFINIAEVTQCLPKHMVFGRVGPKNQGSSGASGLKFSEIFPL